MKTNEKGITLIALIITIIVLFLILGIASTTGMETYRNMKVQSFIAQMKLLQTGVDKINTEYRNWENHGKTHTVTIYNGGGEPIGTEDVQYNINDYIDELIPKRISGSERRATGLKIAENRKNK